MTITHPLATAWLERVDRLAADLQPGVRSELLADLREHLHAALPTDPDSDEVRAVLDRLGDPVDVVAAARGGDVVPPAPDGSTDDASTGPASLQATEVIALAALILAGLFAIFVWPLTLLLWATGIVLVAVAGRWRGGEVLGMILLPVAWVLPVAGLVVPVGTTSQTCTADSSGVEVCTEATGGIVGPWALVIALVVLVLIVLVTRWLARAPRGRLPRR